ncbi:MAG: hypothetical protein NTU53_04330 [Planctomycetota bacterium]|nr:hypothetical protein [Planctomycetota bacterium]
MNDTVTGGSHAGGDHCHQHREKDCALPVVADLGNRGVHVRNYAIEQMTLLDAAGTLDGRGVSSRDAGGLMKKVILVLLLICIARTARGYIEPVVEDQDAVTLPRLLLHFHKSVAVVDVQRVDMERGLVRFGVVERIQGAEALKDMRQVILQEGRIPDALRKLKVGQKAVFFGEDSEGQSFLYVEGLWCHSLLRDDSGWRRLHEIRPIYNGCFTGSADELIVALKRLVMGQEAVVRSRPRGSPQEVWVRYSMRMPAQRTPVDASQVPHAQETPRVDAAQARELREKELAELRQQIRQFEQQVGPGDPHMRALRVEFRKREEGLESEQQRAERLQQNRRLELREIEKRMERLRAELRELERERERLQRDLKSED